MSATGVSSESRGAKASSGKPLGRVARKRKARQEKMLGIALRIVEEGGLESLTIKQIAAEMDLVMGAIYRYFPSKQDLLHSLRDRSLQQMESVFARRYEELDAWLKEFGEGSREVCGALRVLVAARGYFTFHRQFPGEDRILDALMSSPDALLADQASDRAQLSLLLGRVARDLAWGLGCTDDEDARQECLDADEDVPFLRHAYVLWATLHGLGHFRKRDGLLHESLQARELQAFAVDALLLGWGMAPGTLSRARQLLQQFIAN